MLLRNIYYIFIKFFSLKTCCYNEIRNSYSFAKIGRVMIRQSDRDYVRLNKFSFSSSMNGPILRKIESILEKYVIDNLYQYQLLNLARGLLRNISKITLQNYNYKHYSLIIIYSIVPAKFFFFWKKSVRKNLSKFTQNDQIVDIKNHISETYHATYPHNHIFTYKI